MQEKSKLIKDTIGDSIAQKVMGIKWGNKSESPINLPELIIQNQGIFEILGAAIKPFLLPIIREVAQEVMEELTMNLILPSPEEAPEEEYLTIKQAAKLLNVTPTTIGNWRRDGYIKVYPKGKRRLYIKKSEILASSKAKGKF